MKILVINKFDPLHPKAGGAEKNLAEIFSRIGARHEVFLLSAMFPGALREERYRNISIIRLGSAVSENVIRIHLLIPFVLRRYLRTIKPDILFEDVSVIPLFTPILSPKQKKTVMIHNFNGMHAFSSQRPLFALISVIAEIFFRILYKKETVIVVSEWMRERLEKSGFTKVHKVLNGVDEDLLKIKKEYAPRPTVLFLGRLEGRKGADLLLETYPIVKRAIGNVQYILAGQEFSFGSARNRTVLDRYRREYPPGDISLPGFVSEEKKQELLKNAWLAAVPSRIEGYGIAVLEANATGTFVIGNDVPGLRESVKNGEAGLLVNCFDAPRFAASIIDWLDIGKLHAKEEACRTWARTHDWEESARVTESLILDRLNYRMAKRLKMNIKSKIVPVIGSLILSLILAEGILVITGYHYLPLKIENLGQPINGIQNDWRAFHMYKDNLFTYDPELIWRPKNNFRVFNSLGFMGEELPKQKGRDDYYIFALGDSNTFGMPLANTTSTWPTYLQEIMRQNSSTKKITVVNAGVPGYTLYQGLQKFKQIIKYKPDIVFIAFGSNEGHRVTIPDKDYLAARSIFAPVSNFRTAQMLIHLYDVISTKQEPPYEPRVNVTDYENFLREIIYLGKANGIRAILLTRPYTQPLSSPSPLWWKNFASNYRNATFYVGKEKSVPVIDIYSHFKDKEEFFADEAHLNDAGLKEMGKVIYKEVKSYLP